MNSRFQQKTAIITGAGSGIGYEIARRLVMEGAQVMLNDIDEALAEKAAGRISAEGPGQCLAFPGDAGSVTFVRQLVAEAVNRFGRLNFCIANAGITLFGDFLEFREADFRKVMEVNLQGSFFLVQAAARQMKAQGEGGRILLLSSVVGKRAYPYLTAYAMTKAALSMMARSLVLEISPYGITINALAPGATLTERTALEDPDYEGVWSKLNPNGRVGTPEDMAKTALFLLSNDAKHINGQTLVVDGGWTGAGHNPQIDHLS